MGRLRAYAPVTLGAARLLILSGNRQVTVWEIVIPALALMLIGYTLFGNVIPYPEGGAATYPAVSAAWIVLGVVLVLVRRRASSAAGERLPQTKGSPAPEPGLPRSEKQCAGSGTTLSAGGLDRRRSSLVIGDHQGAIVDQLADAQR
jgi:hypothetical protein